MGHPLRISFPGSGRQPQRFPPSGTPVRFGRPASGQECDVVLADPAVSRLHAEAAFRDGRWLIRSVGRAGTLLDQRRIADGEWLPLEHGTIIGIGPFLMRIAIGPDGTPQEQQPLTIADDGSRVRAVSVPAEALERVAELRLSALLDASARIMATDSAQAVADAVVAVASSARDFERVAVVEARGDAAGGSWVSRAAAGVDESARRAPLSRTLLAAAQRAGTPVRLDQDLRFREAESMMGTQEAVCVPMGPSADGHPSFLYADCRQGRTPGAAAVAFLHLLARLASSAVDAIGRRGLVADLEQARQIQRRLLPPERGSCGHVSWSIFSRPADTRVSGDFIAVAEGAGGRVAAMLGDVAGKGPAAGLVMAAMVTHFDTSVRAGLSVEDAVTAASEFLASRPALEVAVAAFTTAIAIEVHPDGSCRGVDAAHSYAALVRADGHAELLAFPSGGTMIGSFPGIRFAADGFRLGPGDRAVLFSDGVAEQRDPAGGRLAADYHVNPGVILAALQGSRTADEDVERLRSLLERHADGASWDDDVTIASLALRS